MKAQILVFLLGLVVTHSASTESSSEDTSTSPGPAILAIEIVDTNSTSSEIRNSTKRTIESALGYGYQSNYYPTSQGKKFMVYPYSQHDIPPAPVKETKYSKQDLNIQKSVSYNLGTKIEASPVKNYNDGGYYPSTLYSTVGQGGIIGGLSTNLQQHVPSPATAIPVIILRVYSNQLTDPHAIYPNIPQNSPYSNLNNINLQTIISNYLQQMYQQQMYSQTPNYAYYNQNTQTAADNLPTHENYPSDSHTRVIYHGPKGHINLNSQYTTPQTQTYTQSTQNYPTNSQYVYTDSKGQNYVYVDPKDLQNGQYYDQQTVYQQQDYQPEYQQNYQQNYQQDYQQDQQNYQQDYQQNYQPTYQTEAPTNYQQNYQQVYQQPEYQQEYQYQQQKPQEDRRYLPTAATTEKVYNYHHADSAKDRSKKSNGTPINFQAKKTETKKKS